MSGIAIKYFDDPVARGRADRIFFVGMALVIVAMDALGFSIAFLKTNIAEELHSTWVKVHVFLFTSWIFLFLAQTTLVASHRTDLHRKLGIAGAADCGLMILITVIGAISAFVNSPPRPAFDHFMLHVVVHVDAIDFAILAIAGILFRNRDSEIHKRLMFLATVVVAARFPFLGKFVQDQMAPLHRSGRLLRDRSSVRPDHAGAREQGIYLGRADFRADAASSGLFLQDAGSAPDGGSVALNG